jgi:hypothetical protein
MIIMHIRIKHDESGLRLSVIGMDEDACQCESETKEALMALIRKYSAECLQAEQEHAKKTLCASAPGVH